MATPQQVLADPNFHALPMAEQLKAMRTIDPTFGALDPKEQGRVIALARQNFLGPAAGIGNDNTPPSGQGFWSTLGSDLLNVGPSTMRMIDEPGEFLRSQTAARQALGPRSDAEFGASDPLMGAIHGIESHLPFVGPGLASAADEMMGGQTGQALAHGVEMAAPLVPGVLPEGLRSPVYLRDEPALPPLSSITKGIGTEVGTPVHVGLSTALPYYAARQTSRVGLRSPIEPVMPGPLPPVWEGNPTPAIQPVEAMQGPMPKPELPSGRIGPAVGTPIATRPAPPWVNLQPTLEATSETPQGLMPKPALPSGRIPGQPQAEIPPVQGSPVPGTAATFKHPAPHTDLIRQMHAVGNELGFKHADLSKAAQAVYGVDSLSKLSYDQGLALNEYLLKNKALPTGPRDLLPGGGAGIPPVQPVTSVGDAVKTLLNNDVTSEKFDSWLVNAKSRMAQKPLEQSWKEYVSDLDGGDELSKLPMDEGTINVLRNKLKESNTPRQP